MGVQGIEPLLSIPRSLAAALSSWMSERVYRLPSNRSAYLGMVSALTVHLANSTERIPRTAATNQGRRTYARSSPRGLSSDQPIWLQNARAGAVREIGTYRAVETEVPQHP